MCKDENEQKILQEGEMTRKYFKAKEGKVNWIVRIPGCLFGNLIAKGRVYMQWRVYRIRGNLNIVRCFKCHAYGHFTKFCTAPDSLCYFRGSKEHERNDCRKKEEPQCMDCMRMKRRDVDNDVKSKNCLGYLRHLDVYRNKVEWG